VGDRRLVTIVVPTIGRREWQRALDSIESQTIPTQWILQPDSGPKGKGAGPTRNLALKRVTTEWVGFCDDDDFLDPHYHEWLIEESPGFDMVIFKMKNSPTGAVPYTTNVDELKYNEVGISFALKTELALKFPFENMIGEDYELIMRVKESGAKIKISERIAYFIGSVNG
jgi:glycosyltransferase involved in cell wall biosynthesis